MSLSRLGFVAFAGWFAILAAVLTTRLVLEVPITLGGTVTAALLGCIPAIVMFLVFRGAGPRNVTQMLYDVDREPSRRLSLETPPNPVDQVPGDPRS